MSVPAAYLGVILIWATTPLAIQWSATGPGFLFGVTARMCLGAVVALALLRLLRQPLPHDRRSIISYAIAGMSIYSAMLAVYWSSQFIPSGWISVLFGLNPLVTAVLAAMRFRENTLGPLRLLGVLMGLAGLGIIFGEGADLDGMAAWGVFGVLFAVFAHAGAALEIRHIQAPVPALAMTTGGLLLASTLLLGTWAIAEGTWPQDLPARAIGSIAYLGVVGSVLGFSLYYYVLKKLGAARIALITLITPVGALMLGKVFNDEAISAQTAWGTAAILVGLGLYFLEDRQPRRNATLAVERE
ncbi:MAG: DMT family transporter [Chromatiales bacterium]|nr:DMT family transporter [Chromatiales bacterium]